MTRGRLRPRSPDFSPARNFFTGALTPGIGKQKSAPAFFSGAAVPRQNYTLWLFAGVDGQVHLLDGINDQVAGRLRWGSDLAGLRAECRPGSQVLATTPQEDAQDSLQAFEMPDREPLAVSQKIALNGSVTAMWTAQNGNAVNAVIHNLATGNYDALQIVLVCNQ
jgi:hypothetical protein